MEIAFQTLAGTIQFDGLTPSAGLFSFAKYNHLPRTTNIKIDVMSYNEDLSGADPLNVAMGFVVFHPGNALTERMVWAKDSAQFGTLINPVTGNAAGTFPGFILPRNPDGEFWSLFLLTQNKEATATGIITYHLVPGPETSARDSK